jgi:hypothetical protein
MLPNIFLSKLIHTYISFTVEKSIQNLWATSVIFKKLPKENNLPIGEKAHNLVALILHMKTL